MSASCPPPSRRRPGAFVPASSSPRRRGVVTAPSSPHRRLRPCLSSILTPVLTSILTPCRRPSSSVLASIRSPRSAILTRSSPSHRCVVVATSSPRRPLALAIRGFCLSPGTDTVPLAAKKDRASSALFSLVLWGSSPSERGSSSGFLGGCVTVALLCTLPMDSLVHVSHVSFPLGPVAVFPRLGYFCAWGSCWARTRPMDATPIVDTRDPATVVFIEAIHEQEFS